MTNGEFAAAILATEPMQAALRALAKDIGATAYAEGLHDAETNPERDRDAAVGRAVDALEQEFHPMRAIAATSGPDGWELSAEGYDLNGAIVYRSGKGQTLGAVIAAALGDDEEASD
jgi:hypothetical protein